MGDISNTQYFRAVQEEKKMEVSQVRSGGLRGSD